jgi:flagellin-like protein
MARFFDRWIAPIFGAVLLIIIVIVIAGFKPTHEALCGIEVNCMREWVSALSGWAGAAMTLATLYALWRQVEAQREQTDFQTGNAEPYVYAFGGTGPNLQPIITLHIANWNRRPLKLNEITVVSPSDFTGRILAIRLNQQAQHRFAHHPSLLFGTIVAGKHGEAVSNCEIDVLLDAPDHVESNVPIVVELLLSGVQFDTTQAAFSRAASATISFLL